MQTASQTEPRSRQTEHAKSTLVPPLLIVIACLTLYFVRLGCFGVLEGGESYYPAAVREMLEAGDMITPRLNYQLYFSKPILTFWLLASAYHIFGLTELAGRLWSAAMCTALALCSYWTTLSFANRRAALLAALMLASSPLLIAVCRRSSIDVFFSFFIGTAVCAMITVLFTRHKKWWPAIYASLALAVLTKGPAGLVLPVLGVALFLAIRRPTWESIKSQFSRLHFLPGIALFIAIAVPWFVAIGMATKGLFLKVFFIYENLGRFAGHTNGKHAYWWWYAVTLLYGFCPWCLFIPSSVYESFHRYFVKKRMGLCEPTAALADLTKTTRCCLQLAVLLQP